MTTFPSTRPSLVKSQFAHKVNGRWYLSAYASPKSLTLDSYMDHVRQAYGSLRGVEFAQQGIDYSGFMVAYPGGPLTPVPFSDDGVANHSTSSYQHPYNLSNAPVVRATLEELAHYDRCLFPSDLSEQLIAAGVDEGDALSVSSFAARNPKLGLVGLYQEHIQDKELCAAFVRILSDHISKYPDKSVPANHSEALVTAVNQANLQTNQLARFEAINTIKRLQQALEIIAVGDAADDARAVASDALVETGIWQQSGSCGLSSTN